MQTNRAQLSEEIVGMWCTEHFFLLLFSLVCLHFFIYWFVNWEMARADKAYLKKEEEFERRKEIGKIRRELGLD